MAQHRIRLGIIFGGMSVEHEISLLSTHNLTESINPLIYDLVHIGISKTGEWFFCDWNKLKKQIEIQKIVSLTKKAFALEEELHLEQLSQKVDVIFPVLHGSFGEDGNIQGLLNCLDVPFVGSGVLGSAMCMDKEITKKILQSSGIPQVSYQVLRREEMFTELQFKQHFSFPVFVKPANAGSSVGVTKCKNWLEFEKAVSYAFQYDHKVIIEEYIPCREIECSILEEEVLTASLPGEIIPHHEFYSYEAKYLDENGASYQLPAIISDEHKEQIQRFSKEAFRLLHCSGLARIDFFLSPQGKVYLNEVNTLPGLTKNSLYPKLLELSGIPKTELFHRLIQQALKKYKLDQSLERSYKDLSDTPLKEIGTQSKKGLEVLLELASNGFQSQEEIEVALLQFTRENCKDIFPDKQESGLKCIDKIYLINLDIRPEKLMYTLEQLKAHNLHATRVPGIEGWKLHPLVLKQYNERLRIDLRRHACKPGQIGCMLTHLSVLKDALKNNFKKIWVIEDDIEVVQLDGLESIIEKLEQFDPNWDVLYTENYESVYPAYFWSFEDMQSLLLNSFLFDPEQVVKCSQKKDNVTSYFDKVHGRIGCWSMIISHHGIRKLVDHFENHLMLTTIDVDRCFIGLNMYQTVETFVKALDNPSISDTNVIPIW